MAAHALAATRAAGLKSNIVFVPRPSATPAQVAQAREGGVVSPLYSGDPAPVGVAYYGLSGTGTGSPVATILNTTAVQGTVDTNATGIVGLDLYQSSPDSYGIQLNSVLTNVTLFGHDGFSFWTQNVVEYYPASGFMVIITNIWNFSGGAYSGHEFYQHGPLGTNAYGELGYYYAELVVPFPVYYPFNLTLTMNSGINGGRDNMSFSDSLVSPTIPSEDFSAANWDYAIFNSTNLAFPGPLTNPSNYTANGESYNPIGLTNDFELDICGPGGGSQVDLGAADATLGLSYLSGASFVAVPAAYNYGGETGETATGANVAWSNAPGGPGGLPEYGTMSTGPSILSGLWGTGAPEGSSAVTLSVTPANAFNFLEYTGTGGFVTPIVAESEFAPTIVAHTLHLMPGSYTLLTELADYIQDLQVITVSGPQTVTVNLAPGQALGVYTPLWAFSNAEVASLAISGSGTPASPYMLPNDQSGPLSPSFGLYNDYGFPVFPGVFLMGTTVSTELYQPASFSAATNDFQFPGDELPQTNDLQLWFWNVSGVSVVDAANISGWFTQTAWYPISFDSFNVIFYESSHNLIAGNHFDTESQALLMFAGGTLFGPINLGGGNNTVWGNTFTEVPEPVGCPNVGHCDGLLEQVFGIGLQLAEDGDLIYDNSFNTPTTAWLLPLNMYSGYPFYYVTNSWNITPQAASIVHFAAGFPNVPLSGSIVGGTTQGGNFWWDYGLAFNPYNGADNPYGQLPYDENAITLIIQIYGPSYYYLTYIYAGGDFAPLVPTVGPAVTFVEHGLVPGTAWGVDITVGSNVLTFNTTSNYFTLSVFTAGHYPWSPVVPVGYAAHGGTFHLTDHPITVSVAYHLATGYAILTLRESGLPPSSSWSVVVAGTTPTTDPFGTTVHVIGTSGEILVIDGSYTFTVPGVPGYAPSPTAGSLTIAGSATLHIRYHIVTYTLSFSETGVPAGKRWGVRITGPVTGHGIHSRTVYTTGASLSFSVPNGTYSYTVLPPAHTVCSPSPGSQSIAGSGASVVLTCVYTPPAHVPVNTSGATPFSAAARMAALRGTAA
jgi:thermopsin